MLHHAEEDLRQRGINSEVGLPDDPRFDGLGGFDNEDEDEDSQSTIFTQSAYSVAETQTTIILSEDDAVPAASEPNQPEMNMPFVRRDPSSLDIGTVDAYQGSQKDFVVDLTTVSASSEPKFMAKAERMCVALTRHMQACLVVGDMNLKTDLLNQKQASASGYTSNSVEAGRAYSWFEDRQHYRIVQRGDVRC